MSNLAEKHHSEEIFHDDWASHIDIEDELVNESFQSPTAIENKYILKNIPCLEGKRILDLGCGAGHAAVYFASKGADVYAGDISSIMLEKANLLAEKYNVKIKTFKITAEKIDFEDNTFDYVYGNGVLHHTVITKTVQEVWRILKPSGRAFFIEPLSYNPIIELYRKIASAVRSPEESPFKYSDLRAIKKIFKKVIHKEFWFFSLYIFVHFYVVKRIDPAKERYWKLVIKEGDKYKVLFVILNFMDKIILPLLYPLRWLCWNTVLILEK